MSEINEKAKEFVQQAGTQLTDSLVNLAEHEGLELNVRRKSFGEVYRLLKAVKFAESSARKIDSRAIRNQRTLSNYNQKELIDVEQCFGELKHFEDMRPFFHKSDEGLKAHIFLCVLTLLIERIIKKNVRQMSQREVIAELKKIKLCKVKDNYVRTYLTQTQQDILTQLGIEVPPKVM